MQSAPKWFLPVAVLALLWNLFGCVMYVMDVRLTPEALAGLSQEMQRIYAIRPTWFVAAYATAVWTGAAGSLGLVLKRRWATPLLVASLLALLVQDAWLFLMSGVTGPDAAAVYGLQGTVLVVAIALVLLARKATAREWLA